MHVPPRSTLSQNDWADKIQKVMPSPMRREVVAILANDPTRRKYLEAEQARYNASAQRCINTGLIPDMPTIRRVTIPAEQ